jgi:hypothetical protein
MTAVSALWSRTLASSRLYPLSILEKPFPIFVSIPAISRLLMGRCFRV